jgi:hypothetical protein
MFIAIAPWKLFENQATCMDTLACGAQSIKTACRADDSETRRVRIAAAPCLSRFVQYQRSGNVWPKINAPFLQSCCEP